MGTDKQYEYKGWDAYPALFSSLWYLITHPKYGAMLYLLLGIGGGRFISNEVEQWTGIHVSVGGKAKAVDVQSIEPQSFEVIEAGEIPVVRVQDKKAQATWQAPDAILVHKKFFGFYDDRFRLWKMKGSNEILVYSELTEEGVKYEVGGTMFEMDKYK